MTTVKTTVGARDQALRTSFQPSAAIPETDVQRAIETVSAGAAPSSAQYVVASATASLPNSRVLTDTATISWNFATANQAKANLVLDSVDNTFLANMAQATVKGRVSGAGTGDPTDLTAAQVKTILALTTTSTLNAIARFADTTGGIQNSGVLIDNSNNLFFPTGTKIDFNAGDVTITHGVDLLTFAGAANGYVYDNTVSTSNAAAGFVGFLATNTDAGATTGPLLVLDRNSASPAANDAMGAVIFRGRSSTGVTRDYGQIRQQPTTVTNAAEEGQLISALMKAGALTDTLVLSSTELRPSSGNPLLGLGSATNPWGPLFVSGSTAGFVGQTMTSTDAGAAAGPIAVFDRNSASPAASDQLGQMLFRGRDSAANATDFAGITGEATVVTNGAEVGRMYLATNLNGTLTNQLGLQSGILFPTTNDGVALGNGSSSFSDLFLASGGVINWNNSTLTLVQNATRLECSGSFRSGFQSGVEGGQLELAVQASGNTLGGTEVVIDVANNVNRFFENGGTFRGAYLDYGYCLGGAGTAFQLAGKQTIWVPATAMFKVTAAAGPSTGQFTSGSTTFQYLAYDAASLEDAMFTVSMPKGWNGGTISAQVHWFHGAAVTNFAVMWQVYAIAQNDNNAISGVAYGGGGTSLLDTGGTANTTYISPEGTAFTIGNSPASGALVHFIMRRDAANGSDTLAVDALLLGVKIFYTTNVPNDL